MGDAYPELRQQQAKIEDALRKKKSSSPKPWTGHGAQGRMEGRAGGEQKPWTARWPFQLYDTYGFPLDLTADICRERDIAIDQAGFDAAMDAQRAKPRRLQLQDGRPAGIQRRLTPVLKATPWPPRRRMCWPCPKTASR